MAQGKGRNFVYVDNSNFFIEGQRLSAVKKQMSGAETIIEAMKNKIVNFGWHPDYGKLYEFACGDPAQIGSANLWGSPPPGDSFWNMVKEHGFQVTVYDKSKAGKEKKVDTAITYQMAKDAHTGKIRAGIDEITLVSGDKDYQPAVVDLVSCGHNVHVVFWGHAA